MELITNSVLFEILYIESVGEHKLKTTRTIFYDCIVDNGMYIQHIFSCGWRAEPYGTYAR